MSSQGNGTPPDDAAGAAERPRGLLRRGSVDTRAKRWAIVTGAVLAVAAAGYFLTKSPVFAARHVEVTGQSHLSKNAVLELADVHHGTNVFWFHAGAVRRRLEKDPWIEHATVSRSLPSTISIHIVERSPVAEVQQPGGGYTVVAADGTVLARTATAGEYPALLVDPAAPGALAAAARVAGGMDPWLRSRVRTIDDRGAQLVIRLQSGIPAYYGDATAATAKDRALAAVLKWAIEGAKPVQSIDVRAPLAPTA